MHIHGCHHISSSRLWVCSSLFSFWSHTQFHGSLSQNAATHKLSLHHQRLQPRCPGTQPQPPHPACSLPMPLSSQSSHRRGKVRRSPAPQVHVAQALHGVQPLPWITPSKPFTKSPQSDSCLKILQTWHWHLHKGGSRRPWVLTKSSCPWLNHPEAGS